MLPLALVIAAALRRECYPVRGRLFERQRWTYTDVVLLFAVLTASAFIDLLISPLALSPIALLALGFLLQAVTVMSAIYYVIRLKYRLPMSTLGWDGSVAYHVAWPWTVIFAVMFLVGMLWLLMLFVDRPASQLIALPGPPRPGSRLAALGASSA